MIEDKIYHLMKKNSLSKKEQDAIKEYIHGTNSEYHNRVTHIYLSLK